MKYLESFELADESTNSELVKKIKNSYTDDEWFPLGFFKGIKLKQIDFEPITIFYGGNGSGKSTLLNLIAEKLNLRREADVSLTNAFIDFVHACKIQKMKSMPAGKMLASEDIFRAILKKRESNIKIEDEKDEYGDFLDYGSLDETFAEMSGTSMISSRLIKKQFIEKNTARKERQFSNGETALQFFKQEITKKKLYLLDEPENSMSPAFQIELRNFLDDAARHNGCQFVIATHSPFILSLPDAKVYNLDITPVKVEKWYDLKNIRAYYDFFLKNQSLFVLGNYDSGGQYKKPKPRIIIKSPPVTPAKKK